ncbi:dipeptidase [Paenibacillus sp. sgz500958]|uniref:dipeptidase n=1 Tax=Paenibacillus sp. sgz500958 TaxID=3242475 RepID=UPI0036D22F93
MKAVSQKIVDFHCDALSKMQELPDLVFLNDHRLDVTAERMDAGGILLQTFAIYLSAHRGSPRFEDIIGQIDRFHTEVERVGGLQWLRWKEEAANLDNDSRKWGMLSLEGVEGLEGNLLYAQLIFELGVRFMGITWNYANWAADGVLERRNGGFTEKGRKLVEWCNASGMLLDVSHLSEAGFWELAELSTRPFIASHSNAAAVCRHPRNLRDEQIRAIIEMDGLMGLTFYPWFVNESGEAGTGDLLKHLEHVCSLGGERHIMFGSDFDGIDIKVKGLEHPGCYPEFAEQLLKHFPEEIVNGWLHGNAISYLVNHLPSHATKG